MTLTLSVVIPGCAEGAGPEAITPVSEYGFPARSLTLAPGNDGGIQ